MNNFSANTTKRLAIGMLAHVDAGKTTLSEGLLYAAGALRSLGRVDHQNAFLDTHGLEKERGITIFSKQAVMELGDISVTLLDTPGHVDFSTETERTLQVLDYAILVISGGVQAHTRTLWQLLKRHGVPVFIFVNKTDLLGPDKAQMLSLLRSQLHDGCVDFTDKAALHESAAMCSEFLMEAFLREGSLSDEQLAGGITSRDIFPVYFGSALKMEGVHEFLEGIRRYTVCRSYPSAFGARVFKITHDGSNRLTWMKITGGRLSVKDVLTNRTATTHTDSLWEEKADQIRLYSGAKFTPMQAAEAGAICAVCGLSRTYPGQGLGFELDDPSCVLEPVLSYRLLFPEGANLPDAYQKLKKLQEEDPLLHLVWDEQHREIQARLMGEVQREVLQAVIKERFGLDVAFGPGTILYKETIAAAVEGIGHYEPLKHFAHVQLLLEPLPLGSGLVFDTSCSEDVLDRNWQRLILTHLQEKQHRGVLTCSPITDMRITLLYGKAHLKHTEGGDFRQATYRAVRQGLMQADPILLEPYYDFRLELPADNLGRAITDIRRMNGDTSSPETAGELSLLTGSAPVSAMGDYAREVAAYTRGLGRLSLTPGGYRPCHNTEEVVARLGYDPEADTENSPDSVFCSHGAGFVVKWNELIPHLARQEAESPRPAPPKNRDADAELMAIYERTYGPVKDRTFLLRRKPEQIADTAAMLKAMDPEESYLLVDGYNIIFAWDDLRAMARESISLARETLIRMLVNYQGYKKCNLILVFDAYKVSGGEEKVEKNGGIYIVYTRKAEIADVYIERVTSELKKLTGLVRVATSDGLEQLIVLGRGALRVPARAFREEVDRACGELNEIMDAMRSQNRGTYAIWQTLKDNS
ncbi:MAG: TetM/TetW/TetO/TetS family tetracycline resistance ribosomal protection protein [Clostridia bacterium]|nr:TetM/TetW/TetO/TetS family tetracycline resistance ribosomal protection protein [Clostridia bacterium]